jgi:heme exporter protein A
MSAVAIEGVWKFFGDYPALRDITFTVEGGRCLALLGRNGAGKTTLLRILAGLSKPARGSITVLGKDARAEITRQKTGVLGHGIGVYEELSAYENLRLFGRLYGVSDPNKTAREWLERAGLDRVRDGLVREFSRGMRQRLAVARAFLHDPSLLLLDEPFTALDDRAIKVLQDLLKSALEEGRTVIMSTHQLREALELATDVALINRGKLAFRGERTREMAEDPGWLYRHYGEA